MKEVNRNNEKNSSIFALVYWFGYAAHRVPIKREEQRKGRSQWSFVKKWQFTIETLIGFTYLPARLITAAGLLSSCLCLVYLGFMVGFMSFGKHGPVSWATLAALQLLLRAAFYFPSALSPNISLESWMNPDVARHSSSIALSRIEPTSPCVWSEDVGSAVADSEMGFAQSSHF